MTGPRIIALAAGGTGGHMFPAEALATALPERGHTPVLITDDRGQGFGDRLPDLAVDRIPAASPSGGLKSLVRALWPLLRGYLAARRVLARRRIDTVVGFGGYAAFPTCLAARHRRIPVILHEQNAFAGRVTRWLAGRAQLVCTSFPAVGGLDATVATAMTGNPVRPAIAYAATRYTPPAEAGPIRVLVLGGSQGARALSEIVPAALALLPDAVRGRLSVVQQCRAEDLDDVRRLYAQAGIAAELSPFFGDVPERLAQSHLVISRSGASTVAELTVAGRPACLIPFPFATDDHQTANARVLAEAGAAWLMPQAELSPAALADHLTALVTAPATLTGAAAAAARLARPDAVDRLCARVLAHADGQSQTRGGRP